MVILILVTMSINPRTADSGGKARYLPGAYIVHKIRLPERGVDRANCTSVACYT